MDSYHDGYWAYDSSTNTVTLSNYYDPTGTGEIGDFTFTISGDGNRGSTYLTINNFKVQYYDSDTESYVIENLGSVTFTLYQF